MYPRKEHVSLLARMCRALLLTLRLPSFERALASSGHSRPRALLSWALLALWGVWACAGCTWEPQAQPVKPQLLLAGPVQIDRLLDDTWRFVLISRNPTGQRRRAIFERAPKKVCDLPEGTVYVGARLVDPTREKGAPLFLLPVTITREGEDRALYYTDEHCKLRGPFGRANSFASVSLDGGGQEVSLIGDGSGNLSMVNPWTEEVTPIASGVSAFDTVRRASAGAAGPIGTQAVWLRENGALTQRALTGELLFTRGKNVTEFEQALFSMLRIAYVDDGTLYEATAPDFQPVRLSPDACRLRYLGVDLTFFSPCDKQQFARIDLTSGALEEFEPGMLWTYEQAGFLIEYVRSETALTLYMTPPGETERKVVSPAITENLQLIGTQFVAGRTADKELVVWDSKSGFTHRIAAGVSQAPLAFSDARGTTGYWLINHDVAEGRGKLRLLQESALRTFVPGSQVGEIQVGEFVGDEVPTSGYSVAPLPQVSEAAIILIEDAEPVSEEDGRLRGRLRARLVSGALGAVVDEGVTSYVTVYTPLQGLVYSVEDGERSGLWFAAL